MQKWIQPLTCLDHCLHVFNPRTFPPNCAPKMREIHQIFFGLQLVSKEFQHPAIQTQIEQHCAWFFHQIKVRQPIGRQDFLQTMIRTSMRMIHFCMKRLRTFKSFQIFKKWNWKIKPVAMMSLPLIWPDSTFNVNLDDILRYIVHYSISKHQDGLCPQIMGQILTAWYYITTTFTPYMDWVTRCPVVEKVKFKVIDCFYEHSGTVCSGTLAVLSWRIAFILVYYSINDKSIS